MSKFKLSDFLKYTDIVIQCHDNPDPDAIASAFGVYAYLKRHGKSPQIIYSGVERIQKRNLQLMLEWFKIKIEYIKNADKFPKPKLLVCVDCQYGQGNVTKIEAEKVAIIDHHIQSQKIDKFDLGVIQSCLGSCSTLVWQLLTGENFDFAKNKDVSTALYYGLLKDTNNFTERTHPLDKDMRDSLGKYCDMGRVESLRLCNYTIEELEIAGVALLRNYVNTDKRYAIFKSEYCDPNILGIIGDFALEVDTVDVCVVYSQRVDGVKMSIRSCSTEVMASELAEFITAGIGSGGGHSKKAGGEIKKQKIDEIGISVDEYMKTKLAEYFDCCDLIHASNHKIHTAKMARYRKNPIPVSYVVSADVFGDGTTLILRTLEGDTEIKASPDTYIMIGVQGEAYPIKSEKFQKSYKLSKKPVNLDGNIYSPTVKNKDTGEIKELVPYMKPCVPTGAVPIFARPLERRTKVFVSWTPEGYLYGSPGDYLAIRCDDKSDVYIINKDIFAKTYKRENSSNTLS
jgi:phosphoglycolate phosphatase